MKERTGWERDRCSEESRRDKGKGEGAEVGDKQVETKETEMEKRELERRRGRDEA